MRRKMVTRPYDSIDFGYIPLAVAFSLLGAFAMHQFTGRLTVLETFAAACFCCVPFILAFFRCPDYTPAQRSAHLILVFAHSLFTPYLYVAQLPIALCEYAVAALYCRSGKANRSDDQRIIASLTSLAIAFGIGILLTVLLSVLLPTHAFDPVRTFSAIIDGAMFTGSVYLLWQLSVRASGHVPCTARSRVHSAACGAVVCAAAVLWPSVFPVLELVALLGMALWFVAVRRPNFSAGDCR